LIFSSSLSYYRPLVQQKQKHQTKQVQYEKESNRLSIRLGDTFRHNVAKAFFVTDVFAVFALHTGCVQEELAAIGAQDNLVKLSLDELVAVLLVDAVLALSDRSHTAKTTASSVVRSLANIRLDFIHTGATLTTKGKASR
jgi:hypothetical protein